MKVIKLWPRVKNHNQMRKAMMTKTVNIDGYVSKLIKKYNLSYKYKLN